MNMKTALITGASDGIGLELARIHAQNGHSLILVARRLERLHALSEELRKEHSVEVLCIGLDLSLHDASSDLYQQVKAAGRRVDFLINNAGVGVYGAFAESNWPKTAAMIDLNIRSLTELTRLFLPDLIAQGGGRIMNVASTAAFQPGPGMAVYFATKAYVLHFSEALHQENHRKGVSVTALCPGPTRSGFAEAMLSPGQSVPPMLSNLHIPDSASVARYAYRAMMRGDAVAVHGLMNRIMAASIGLFPRRLVVRISARITGAK
jgi:short-subunit dehydrogenase